MRAARAARLFFLIQPIRSLFSGAVVAVAVAVVLAKALCRLFRQTQLISLHTSSYANNNCFSRLFRFTEYMGCFTILDENRIFVSSPGDYNLQDISPLYCLRQCGKKYRYATLQEGNICLCADSLPTRGQVDDSECDKPCPGHQSWPSKDQASLK